MDTCLPCSAMLLYWPDPCLSFCSMLATIITGCMPSSCSMLPQLFHCSQTGKQHDSYYSAYGSAHLSEPLWTHSPSPYCRQSATPNKGPHYSHPSLDPNHPTGFQSGAGRNMLPACTICLGCLSHKVIECNASTTWDGLHKNHCQIHLRGTPPLTRQSTPLHWLVTQERLHQQTTQQEPPFLRLWSGQSWSSDMSLSSESIEPSLLTSWTPGNIISHRQASFPSIATSPTAFGLASQLTSQLSN